MPASTIPRRSIQTSEPFSNVHSIAPAPKISASQTKTIDATMLRCPTTSTATSSPRSEQDNDNTSETSSMETMSAESCESFCTTRQYPSPSEKPCDLLCGSDEPPVHLDRIYQDNLCVEMLSLYETLLPSRESYERRMNLVRRIEDLLNAEWPAHDIRVHLFGSSVNDLGASYSDVDMCITTPWHGLRNVRTLAKMFRKCGMQNVVCVPRAKVPIVRLFDPESQLACDINVNNTLALHNTEMIKTYVALDPRVRPLIMIIKHWTKQRRINDAANGGTLSTYTWTCMVINFLQMRNPPILPVLHQMVKGEDESAFCTDVESLRGFGSKNHESLGGLLFAFFRHYAVEFDYEEQVVSVRHGRYLDKREKGWNTGRNRQSLCVEEPFNVARNLGNSADEASVKGLINEFRRAFHLLLEHASLDLICEPYRPALQEHSPSPSNLNSVLGNRSLAPPPPPPVVLPVHPHSLDTRRRQSQFSEEMYGSNSYPLSASPSATYSIPFTQHNQLAVDKGYRPRFNSSTIPAQATSPPFRLRNARFGSHPMPYCTTMSNGVPIAITIALPPPSSYTNAQNTTAQATSTVERPTVDHIFARYTNQPIGQMDENTRRLSYQGRRRSSASSYNKRPPSGSHRRQSVLSQRRRSSAAEWPAISPSTSTAKSIPQPQQSQQRSRRRWSTVKKSSEIPVVPVKKKEVKAEETPKPRVRQQQQQQPQSQQQQQQSSRNKKTGPKQKKRQNKTTFDNKR